jgi:hypothetical protein
MYLSRDDCILIIVSTCLPCIHNLKLYADNTNHSQIDYILNALSEDAICEYNLVTLNFVVLAFGYIFCDVSDHILKILCGSIETIEYQRTFLSLGIDRIFSVLEGPDSEGTYIDFVLNELILLFVRSG